MAKALTIPTDVYADPPRKHVMLLSCMDQRLLDNIVHFMNELNLQNRYDQVIFAGAAMGAAKLRSPLFPKDELSPPLPWRDIFFDHLETAIDGLDRPIHDIFLLEHMDCGAYKELHPDEKTKRDYKRCNNAAGWRPFHISESTSFAADVVDFCLKKSARKKWQDMRVWSLLMDLRGHVETLDCSVADRQPRSVGC